MLVTAPAQVSIDPFFYLIGVVYALTMVYALTLKQVDDRRWLIDPAARGRCRDRLRVHLFHRGGHQLLRLAVRPADAAGSVVQARRGGVFVAMLSAILYVEIVVGQFVAAMA